MSNDNSRRDSTEGSDLFRGYGHPGYPDALAEFGTPVALSRSGGWFLRRRIPGSPWSDGISPYPYLACHDWSSLATDLSALDDDLVSLTATPCPFGDYTLDDLKCAFPDWLVHFKDHFVADLSIPVARFASRHHLKLAERSLRGLTVEFTEHPAQHLDEWVTVFEHTKQRFGISGIRAFSRESFAKQFALPGVVMSLARRDGRAIAVHVHVLHGDVAYAHVAAATPEARTLNASYALYLEDIRCLSARVRWIDWGGSAGIGRADSGLTAFKRGWSTETRPAFIGGRILHAKRYRELTRSLSKDAEQYFPPYRSGEFG